MKEFPSTYAFKDGLRRLKKMPRNSNSLVGALNCRVEAGGLEPFVPIGRFPAIGDLDLSAFEIDNIPLDLNILSRDQVFLFDTMFNTTEDGSGVLAYIFDLNGVFFGGPMGLLIECGFDGDYSKFLGYADIGATSAPIEFADFQKYGIMVCPAFYNGDTYQVLYRDMEYTPQPGYYGLSWTSITQNEEEHYRSVCNFRGQLIACDGRSVYWGRIGGGGPGAISEGDRDTSGSRPMPWRGTVDKVITIGKGVFVTGENGAALLIPVAQPIPTFGLKEVHKFGIAACGGDELEIAYVDKEGYLWKMGEDHKETRLGYEEFLKPLVTEGNLRIMLDRTKRDFYIASPTKCYLLSQFGLTQIYQVPWSLARVNGQLVGMFEETPDMDYAEIVNDVFDMGVRGIKTIEAMELGADGVGMSVAIDYRYSTGAEFSTSRYKKVNRLGQVAPVIGGVEFRARIRSESIEDFNLDYMNIRYKLVDKRFIRGSYGTKNVDTSA